MGLFETLRKNSRKKKYDYFIEMMQPEREQFILDIGASNGPFLEQDYPHRDRIIALDISMSDLIELHQRYPQVICILGNGKQLPFKDHVIPVIFANAVIEHVGDYENQKLFAEEIQRGRKMKLDVANEAYTDVDVVARKVTSFLQSYGADPSNSSVVTAALLYWAGVNASAGIPTPNRKLGGVCRIAAGAPGGRIASLPTEKLNNKISGFAAVLATYEALQKEHMAPFDPILLPVGLAGSPV